LEGKGLTWTDGRPVEGYSNFLWLLCTALLGAVGFDLILALRILGFVCVWAAVLALVMGYARMRRAPLSGATVGGLALVLSGPVAAWMVGGLEQPMVAALLAWTVALCFRFEDHDRLTFRDLLIPGILLGCLCLTRPDGPLFCLVFGLWLVSAGRFKRSSFRNAFLLLIIPVVMVVCHLGFRLWYYGEWLPNTAYVKIVPSALHFEAGYVYVGRGFVSLRPLAELTVAVLLLLCFDRRRRTRALLLLAIGIVWLGYVVFIGGDIFGAWRHFIPFVVVIAFTLALLVEWVFEGKKERYGSFIVLVPVFVWFVFNQFNDPGNDKAKKEIWGWNSKTVGLVLKKGFTREQPTLAVTAAGGLPYWSELPSLDLLGLNDYYLARKGRSDSGQRWIGHGKGDIDYVLGRKPDLMIFGTAGGGKPKFAYENIADNAGFTDNYDACYFASLPDSFVSRTFVNRFSDKIGIKYVSSGVTVPPYLLNAWHTAFAMVDDNGEFYVYVFPRGHVGIRRLELSKGRWRVIAPKEGVDVVVFYDREPIAYEDVDGSRVFDIPVTNNYDVLVGSASGSPVRVYGLRLQPVAALPAQ
jgi:hypothetical protein